MNVIRFVKDKTLVVVESTKSSCASRGFGHPQMAPIGTTLGRMYHI